MNRVATQTSVIIYVAMWLAVFWATSILHPEAFDIPAIALFGMAFAMWLGFGDRLAFRLLWCAVPITFVVTVLHGLPMWLFHFYSDASIGLRTLIGFCFIGMSVLIIIRYCAISSLNNPTQRPPTTSGWPLVNDSLMPIENTNAHGKPIKPLPQYEGRLTELSWLRRLTLATWGDLKFNRSGALWTLFCCLLVGSLAVYYRGNAKTTAALLSLTVILLTLLPPCLFFNRTEQTFRLLWVLGIGDKRITTARWQLFLIARRYLPWLFFVMLVLTIQARPSLPAIWLCLMTVAFSVTVAGLMLWLLVFLYSYWLRIAEIVRLLIFGSFSSVAFIILIWFFDGVQPELPKFLSHLGMVGPLAIAIFVAFLAWAWCIFHGARGFSQIAID